MRNLHTNRILIVPIDSIDPDILKDIAISLEKAFHFKVDFGKEISVPGNAFNPKRKQFHSTVIINKIQDEKPKTVDRILGVIDVDLYVPGLNFVFGEADIVSGITIISLTRLRQEFYGLNPDRKLLKERAVKEAIHEIGHTLGLGHCSNPECIMFFSNSIIDTDRKGPGCCNTCRNILGI